MAYRSTDRGAWLVEGAWFNERGRGLREHGLWGVAYGGEDQVFLTEGAWLR